MGDVVPIRSSDDLSRAAKGAVLPNVIRSAGLVLAGALAASLMAGWTAFLIWLAFKIVIAIVHWL